MLLLLLLSTKNVAKNFSIDAIVLLKPFSHFNTIKTLFVLPELQKNWRRWKIQRRIHLLLQPWTNRRARRCGCVVCLPPKSCSLTRSMSLRLGLAIIICDKCVKNVWLLKAGVSKHWRKLLYDHSKNSQSYFAFVNCEGKWFSPWTQYKLASNEVGANDVGDRKML